MSSTDPSHFFSPKGTLQTFTHFQIQLDDMEDADALAFFPQCIAFIEDELEKGRGVLVHCQAGMSEWKCCTICTLCLTRLPLDRSKCHDRRCLSHVREADRRPGGFRFDYEGEA